MQALRILNERINAEPLACISISREHSVLAPAVDGEAKWSKGYLERAIFIVTMGDTIEQDKLPWLFGYGLSASIKLNGVSLLAGSKYIEHGHR